MQTKQIKKKFYQDFFKFVVYLFFHNKKTNLFKN